MDIVLMQFIYFILYSFIGWICETSYCWILNRKFTNRGFLNGPFCPIYGVGAILVINLFSWCSDNILLLFLLSTIVTSIVEYLTSYILQVVFHLQLWDYSKRIININGRVCLRNSFLFGIMSVLLVRVIQPNTQLILNNLPFISLVILTSIFGSYFVIDTLLTARSVMQINNNAGTRQIQLDELAKLRNEFKQKFQTYKATRLVMIHHKFSHRRFIKAFPNMKSSKYQEALNEIKKEILQKTKKL